MSKVFITGDIHGLDSEMRRFTTSQFPEGKQLTKKDYVVILGDFGWLWYHPKHPKFKSDRYWLRWLQQKPWTTLFIDGNHENYELLGALDSVKQFSGEVGKVNDSVFHLKRGYVYKLAGKTFFAFGGAESTDKDTRKPGIHWWPQEIPSVEEQNFGLANLKQFCNEVDFILTHTAPAGIIEQIATLNNIDLSSRVADPTAVFLEGIATKVTFEKWFFGHFHIDSPEVAGTYTGLYKSIVQLL